MGIASDNDNNYCMGCGAKYKKEYQRWLPIKLIWSNFQLGMHGIQTGYTFGGAKVFSTVIRLGWLRIVFGTGKGHKGYGCHYDKNAGVMVHEDIYKKAHAWEHSYSDYVGGLFGDDS